MMIKMTFVVDLRIHPLADWSVDKEQCRFLRGQIMTPQKREEAEPGTNVCLHIF